MSTPNPGEPGRRPEARVKDKTVTSPEVQAILDQLAEVETETPVVSPFTATPTSPFSALAPSPFKALSTGPSPFAAASSSVFASRSTLSDEQRRMLGGVLAARTRSNDWRSVIRRGAKAMNRTIVLLPPPPRPKEIDGPWWWMPAYAYEECFEGYDGGDDGIWRIGCGMDFDDSIESRMMMGFEYGIAGSAELTAVTARTREDMLDNYESWEPQSEEWEEIAQLFSVVREQVFSEPECILPRMEALYLRNFAAAQAGMRTMGMSTSGLVDVDERIVLDDLKRSDARKGGLAAATVDYMLWRNPYIFGDHGKRIHELMKIATLDDFPPPPIVDICVFDQGFTPGTFDSERGYQAKLLRGQYVISGAEYLSAADPERKHKPWGIIGWRLLSMTPASARRTIHGYDEDCDCAGDHDDEEEEDYHSLRRG